MTLRCEDAAREVLLISIVVCYAAKDTLVGSAKAAQRTDHVLIPLGGATATCFGMSTSRVVTQPFFSNGVHEVSCNSIRVRLNRSATPFWDGEDRAICWAPVPHLLILTHTKGTSCYELVRKSTVSCLEAGHPTVEFISQPQKFMYHLVTFN